MNIVTILVGEELFSKDGKHILDEKGLATKAKVQQEVTLNPEVYQAVLNYLVKSRLARGLNTDGSEKSPDVVNNPELSPTELAIKERTAAYPSFYEFVNAFFSLDQQTELDALKAKKELADQNFPLPEKEK